MKHELGIRYLGNREQARKQITRRIVNTCRRILLALREEPLPEQFRLPLLPNGKKPGCDVIGGENSSRTILSTGQAAENIGCRVRCINPATLSLTKGESWWETVQTFAEQGTQIIAIRSGHEGLMVHLAMMQETVKPGRLTDPSLCFINCGEGTREHPTQYEQDVATIFLRHLGARWLDQNDREILERAFSRPSAQEQLEQEAAEVLAAVDEERRRAFHAELAALLQVRLDLRRRLTLAQAKYYFQQGQFPAGNAGALKFQPGLIQAGPGRVIGLQRCQAGGQIIRVAGNLQW